MKTKRPTSLISLLIAPIILCAASVASGETVPEAGNKNTAPIAAKDLGKPILEVWDEDFPGPCSLVAAMDGTVLIFKEQAQKGIVEVKRSEDGGKTWSEPTEVGKRVKIDGDMSDDGRYKGPEVGWSQQGSVMVDENTGDIIVFAVSLKPAQICYRSKDHGKTWTTEDIVIRPDVNGWLSSPNGACDPGITLRFGPKKGRLLQTSRVFVEYLNKGKGGRAFDKHYANAIYSDDGGKTWTPSAPFPLGGTGEAGLVELRDGRIYYNSRTHMRPGNRRIAYSLDGGESWPVKRLVRKGAGNYTWLAAGRKGTPSEGMIYLAAGKDWMARFNLAWILEGADKSQTPAEPVSPSNQ